MTHDPLHRNRAGLLLAALAALLITALAPRRAFAYCRTTTCQTEADAGHQCRTNKDGCVRDGVPVVWKTSPIVYRFYAGGSQKLDDARMRAAVRRAFNEWASVECDSGRTSLRFQEGPDIKEDKAIGADKASEKFGIYFRDEEWTHNDTSETLAITKQFFGRESGAIYYADIEVNTAETTFRLTDEEDGDDLQAVMTHEVGHYIGLAHSRIQDSIMVEAYCQDLDRCGTSTDVARQLADDDRDAVCALYPPVETPKPAATGCTQTSETTPSAAAAGLALFFLICALVRRRQASS